MERKEFEQRAGYYPTLEEYAVIEKHYMCFDGDKDAFCKAYKKNEGSLAEKIQRQTDDQRISAQAKTNKIMEQLTATIAKLEAQLEREQEWKAHEDTDNVSQADYTKLASDSSTKHMTDDEAKDLLYDWYGFAKEKLTIYHSVPVYEVNRHRELRKTGELDRSPLYNATDWNYIRFDCGCMSYELHDDDLRPYIR